MKTDLKSIDLFEIEYINLPENLIAELELKIENLYINNQFRFSSGIDGFRRIKYYKIKTKHFVFNKIV
ncbi:hypothetical protein [Mucilaginibacter gracilis]|nr:hypothetical protein [Mucilaginibacter gracilis]